MNLVNNLLFKKIKVFQAIIGVIGKIYYTLIVKCLLINIICTTNNNYNTYHTNLINTNNSNTSYNTYIYTYYNNNTNIMYNNNNNNNIIHNVSIIQIHNIITQYVI